ncbi:MAG: hypothetical protein LBV69_11130, partial [Bacteroidales bacterium]|nr:hypothetical protein [Bacteroidales bacterium]
CEKGAFSDEELAKYDYYWDSISTEKAFLSTSYADGKAEGITVGKAEGIAVGKAEGEREKTIKIVLNSYKSNFSIENISTITELSSEQIIIILKEHRLL